MRARAVDNLQPQHASPGARLVVHSCAQWRFLTKIPAVAHKGSPVALHRALSLRTVTCTVVARAARPPRAGAAPHGLPPALHPLLCGLERVEGCCLGITAAHAPALLVLHEMEVIYGINSQRLQAVGKKVVLSPVLGLPLLAGVQTLEVGLCCTTRNRLQRTIEPWDRNVTGLDEDLAARVRRQVLGQAVGQQHAVGVGLDGPVVLPESTILTHLFPHVHEELCIRCEAGVRFADERSRRLESQGAHLDTCVRLPVQRQRRLAENRRVVAGKDPCAPRELRAHNFGLVALGPAHCEAEELDVRRSRFRRQCRLRSQRRSAGPQRLARAMLAGLAAVPAFGIPLVLLIADHACSGAAPGILAVHPIA